MLLLSFNTLISIYIVGTQEPFKDGVKRIMDLFNEFLVLVLNYHLMCFTNFVSDPYAREYLGYSMTFVTCLFIAINLGYASGSRLGTSPPISSVYLAQVRVVTGAKLRFQVLLPVRVLHILNYKNGAP